MRKCTVEDCCEKYFARGACVSHYRELVRSGAIVRGKKPMIGSRFWEYMDSSGGPDSCWEWSSYKNPQGYGKVKHKGKSYFSHRYAWILTNGEIPEGMLVCHRCDNPPCCNPKHLFIGTYLDNSRDKFSKGRQRYICGVENNQAKLNPEIVQKIRHLYSTGDYTQIGLGRHLGIPRTTVRNVLIGRTWKHLR